MDTSLRWELICDGLVSHSGAINDSNPLITTETGNKHLHCAPSWLDEGCFIAINVLLEKSSRSSGKTKTKNREKFDNTVYLFLYTCIQKQYMQANWSLQFLSGPSIYQNDGTGLVMIREQCHIVNFFKHPVHVSQCMWNSIQITLTQNLSVLFEFSYDANNIANNDIIHLLIPGGHFKQ